MATDLDYLALALNVAEVFFFFFLITLLQTHNYHTGRYIWIFIISLSLPLCPPVLRSNIDRDVPISQINHKQKVLLLSNLQLLSRDWESLSTRFVLGEVMTLCLHLGSVSSAPLVVKARPLALRNMDKLFLDSAMLYNPKIIMCQHRRSCLVAKGGCTLMDFFRWFGVHLKFTFHTV